MGWEHVQNLYQSQNGGSFTSLTGAFPSSVTVGNLIIAVVFAPSALTGLTIKDANGNTFTLTPNSPSSGSQGSIYVGYLLAAPSNISASIKASWTSPAVSSLVLEADEFSSNYVQVFFDVDIAADNAVANTLINAPTITPTQVDTLFYGAWAMDPSGSPGSNPNPPWTFALGGGVTSDSVFVASTAPNGVALSIPISSSTWTSLGVAFYGLVFKPISQGFQWVQNAITALTGSGVTTISITLASNPVQGDIVLVGLGLVAGGSISNLTLKDSNNNVYTLALTHIASPESVSLFYLIAPANASNVITATWTTSSRATLIADEFTVIGGSTGFDKAVFSTGSSSPTSLTLNNGVSKIELAYAVCLALNLTVTTGNVADPFVTSAVEFIMTAAYNLNNSTGAASFTLSASSPGWIEVGAMFALYLPAPQSYAAGFGDEFQWLGGDVY